MYPRLDIDLGKLAANAQTLVRAAAANGIGRVFLVTKVLAGDVRVVAGIAAAGFSHVADSRLENLVKFKDVPLPKALLRLPMIGEADRVVKYADLSLNAEIETIRALGRAAVKARKIHEVVLMFDLGDLREGFWHQDDYLPFVRTAASVSGIRIAGIGTNLTCYGGVIPDAENLGRLVSIKNRIESETGIRIDVVSGGNSSTVHLFGKHVIPAGVNSLRLGEAVFLGRETAYGEAIPGMHRDAFTLRAELIEVRDKPSRPEGNVGMNSFGERPVIENRGIMRRGLLAVGRQDVEAADLTPRDARVDIVGASSDHLIVDLTRTAYRVGDKLAFDVDYAGLLRLMTSRYVHKRHLH